MPKQIASLSGIDLDSLRLEDIRWHSSTGIAVSSGSGRDRTYSYRTGVITDLGDIKTSLWRQIAEAVAQRRGEQWLVDALTEWERAHNYTKVSASQLRLEALHKYSMSLQDWPEWVDYIPFNRKYRPQVLEQAHIVTVFNACCGKPGEVTQEQIDRAWRGQIACPCCGRWSLFSICLPDGTLPWEESAGGQ